MKCGANFMIHNPNVRSYNGSHPHYLGSRYFVRITQRGKWCWRCSLMCRMLFTKS